jgi:hypothetical protein
MHRAIRTADCCNIFSDYRLRVAAVVRGYGLTVMKRQPTAAKCMMCSDHPGNLGSDRLPWLLSISPHCEVTMRLLLDRFPSRVGEILLVHGKRGQLRALGFAD